jgi:periplasmic protein TonB
MFDLVLGKIERPYRKRSTGATTASVFGHVVVIGTVVVLPLLFATEHLPKVPVMMAFVAPPAAPPPPPPPPPAPASAKTRPAAAAPSSTNPNAAPLEVPTQIKPEPAVAPSGGQPGGVEGGIEGGVAGGIVGGLIAEAIPPPAPPPPPPPPPREPVRIGGLVVAPALRTRVEPEYPPLAVAAHVEGMVILEATVDTEGRVTDVRILRSIGFLDKAAINAVQQWRYAPLTLNGMPTPFVLTVTLNFSLKQARPMNVG